MQLFQQARAALGAVHPWFPALVLMFVIWAPAAAIRRWLPALWEGPANWGPFGAEELTPIWKVLRKAWQAIPAAAAGAFLTAIAAGDDTWAPVLGAVIGLGAPAFHEAKKLAGKAGKRVLGVAVLSLVLVSSGNVACSSAKDPSGYVERGLAVAFSGVAVAIQVLTDLEADRVDAIAEPTPEQLQVMKDRLARLQRATEALRIARDWLQGDPMPDESGRKALADATMAATLLADEVEADGAKVPADVRRGLAAASAWLGAS